MRKIMTVALTILMLTASLCMAVIYAETDGNAKLSEKLKRKYEANDATYLAQVYIYYEDIDLEAIEAEVTEQIAAHEEAMRASGNYSEKEIQEECEAKYRVLLRETKVEEYFACGTALKEALGLSSATISRGEPYIRAYLNYESAIIVAQNEEVLKMTLGDNIEAGIEETDAPTDVIDTVPDTYEPTELNTVGDLNMDGMIDASDASGILILASKAGTGYTPANEELYAADYNADGNADATDASLILIFAAEEGVK